MGMKHKGEVMLTIGTIAIMAVSVAAGVPSWAIAGFYPGLILVALGGLYMEREE
jgi:thiamine transporter ThiT